MDFKMITGGTPMTLDTSKSNAISGPLPASKAAQDQRTCRNFKRCQAAEMIFWIHPTWLEKKEPIPP